ncbi:flagellin lysine-N-methylase [Metabacillus endolithicus]|uniref:flagellin lysine-N-methylase n=1 Tax=Metabacillus endolithicus TaxID=1535204 RepID=UPI001FF88A4C|nr:flagellin lysine-N-methylase [Metabacillus endolithicus]UPG65364.1 flagellin lysine-N-methylase [Metabacillus endolithicus]
MKTLNKQVTLVPQYMNKFSCIGSECEDSCCSGWKVTIDQPTYKKYKKSRHIELKELFDKNIIRNRSNPSEADYAKIKLDKGGNCPFLSEEKLCRVQMNLGEENLSTTCTTYPRSNHLIDGIIERSLTLSCPEAARLALLEPNGIEFDEVENAVESNIFISKKFKGDSPANNGKPAQYFWELRFFTIQLLQNRNYSIEDRLVILGMFLKKVQEIISLNKVNDIPQIIGQYVKVIDEGSLRKELDNIPTQNRIQMKLTKAIIDRRFLDGVNSPRFIECLKESLMGMGYITNASMSEVTDKYNHAFETYYSTFLSRT